MHLYLKKIISLSCWGQEAQGALKYIPNCGCWGGWGTYCRKCMLVRSLQVDFYICWSLLHYTGGKTQDYTVALIQNAFSVLHICFVNTVRTKFAWPLWDPQMKCLLFSLQQSPDGSVKVLFGMQIFPSLSKNIFCVCMHCRILLLYLGVNHRK